MSLSTFRHNIPILILLPLVLFLALPSIVYAQIDYLLIFTNSDKPKQCEPTEFSWVNGTAPYQLSISAPGDPQFTSIVRTFDAPGNLTWTADACVGSTMNITMVDSRAGGGTVWTFNFTIDAGSTDGCIQAEKRIKCPAVPTTSMDSPESTNTPSGSGDGSNAAGRLQVGAPLSVAGTLVLGLTTVLSLV
ncbi:hypothetical protein C8Q80DRAFT_1342329 [Daedaleopsis nitida]|nr:hypothetical protein C8Q80DRAFT_1342329 [Daedaleopsis nitida]